jgi:hypothetical protein
MSRRFLSKAPVILPDPHPYRSLLLTWRLAARFLLDASDAAHVPVLLNAHLLCNHEVAGGDEYASDPRPRSCTLAQVTPVNDTPVACCLCNPLATIVPNEDKTSRLTVHGLLPGTVANPSPVPIVRSTSPRHCAQAVAASMSWPPPHQARCRRYQERLAHPLATTAGTPTREIVATEQREVHRPTREPV